MLCAFKGAAAGNFMGKGGLRCAFKFQALKLVYRTNEQNKPRKGSENLEKLKIKKIMI